MKPTTIDEAWKLIENYDRVSIAKVNTKPANTTSYQCTISSSSPDHTVKTVHGNGTSIVDAVYNAAKALK